MQVGGCLSFVVWNPVKVHFGVGMLSKLKEFLDFKLPIFICDPVVERVGLKERLSTDFKNAEFFLNVEPNPSCEFVDSIVSECLKYDVDGVVGIGGGSTLDTAKAVSALLVSGGILEDYLLGGRLFTGRKRLVLIPTTAGTGSEVTNVGVYTYKGLKKPMTSDFFWADLAVVDPTLTYSMPPRLTASTGLDALAHAVESYWAKSSQPYTEGLALRALKLIFENLRDSISGIREARDNMAVASTIAGIAFSQTRTTAAHAISFPLTSFYGIEHGLAVALTLPEVIRYVYPHAKEKMDSLLRYIGLESIDELIDGIREIFVAAGLSTRLKDYGVQREDIPKIATVAMEANIIKLTPGDITKEDVEQILINTF